MSSFDASHTICLIHVRFNWIAVSILFISTDTVSLLIMGEERKSMYVMLLSTSFYNGTMVVRKFDIFGSIYVLNDFNTVQHQPTLKGVLGAA